MSIKDLPEKIKSFAGSRFERLSGVAERRDMFISGVILLVALGSFGLGRISAEKSEKSSIRIEGQVATFSGLQEGKGVAGISSALSKAVLPVGAKTPLVSTTAVFASKNGKKYYYPRCSSRVTDANKVWFDTPQKAEALGFTLATNCNASQR